MEIYRQGKGSATVAKSVIGTVDYQAAEYPLAHHSQNSPTEKFRF